MQVVIVKFGVIAQGSLARRDLWYEAALLKKLLYKSKNQHRSSKHFQCLSEVCRLHYAEHSPQQQTL